MFRVFFFSFGVLRLYCFRHRGSLNEGQNFQQQQKQRGWIEIHPVLTNNKKETAIWN
jgi:hypothetical protein